MLKIKNKFSYRIKFYNFITDIQLSIAGCRIRAIEIPNIFASGQPKHFFVIKIQNLNIKGNFINKIMSYTIKGDKQIEDFIL